MPTTTQKDNSIDIRDIVIDTLRVGSANTIVRIFHKPSGIYVESGEKHSIHQNRLEAMQKLKEMLEQRANSIE
jgi:protein subunit release factor A